MGGKKNVKTFHQEFNLPRLAKDSPGDDCLLRPLFSWDQPCPRLSHQDGSAWLAGRSGKSSKLERVTSTNLGGSQRESESQEVRQPSLSTRAGTD